MDSNATTIKGVGNALLRLIRDNIFGGLELALLEPLDGPRPDAPHCTIAFVQARPHQRPIRRYEQRDDGLYEIIRGTRYCRYRITFFGDDAYQKAIDCQNRIMSALGAEFMLAPIAGFGQLHEVREATAEYLGRQEERAFFDIDLYAKFSAEYPWHPIGRVVGEALI